MDCKKCLTSWELDLYLDLLRSVKFSAVLVMALYPYRQCHLSIVKCYWFTQGHSLSNSQFAKLPVDALLEIQYSADENKTLLQCWDVPKFFPRIPWDGDPSELHRGFVNSRFQNKLVCRIFLWNCTLFLSPTFLCGVPAVVKIWPLFYTLSCWEASRSDGFRPALAFICSHC